MKTRHLALSIGRVACNGKLTISMAIQTVTKNWKMVTCRRCQQTDYFKWWLANYFKHRSPASTESHRKELAR